MNRWSSGITAVQSSAPRGYENPLGMTPTLRFPVALGVIYDDPAPTFEAAVIEQNRAASEGKSPDIQKLVSKGQTWQVDKEPRKE